MIPGEIIASNREIELNTGRLITKLVVANLGDRPIQVGSHFHFFEVNKALRFERKLAYAKRLNIPSGTAVRFEPGEEKTIELVDFAGQKKIVGFNNLVDGLATSINLELAMNKIKQQEFANSGENHEL